MRSRDCSSEHRIWHKAGNGTKMVLGVVAFYTAQHLLCARHFAHTSSNTPTIFLKCQFQKQRRRDLYRCLISKPMTLLLLHQFSSVQFSSVAQSCPTLCDPTNRSTPGLPVHHHLPEFTHTHVHRVSDAIQPSHPLLSPSPPAPASESFPMSQLFACV